MLCQLTNLKHTGQWLLGPLQLCVTLLLQRHHQPGEDFPDVPAQPESLAYPAIKAHARSTPHPEFDCAVVTIPLPADREGDLFPKQSMQGWRPGMREPWMVPTHDRLGMEVKYPFFLAGMNGEESAFSTLQEVKRCWFSQGVTFSSL